MVLLEAENTSCWRPEHYVPLGARTTPDGNKVTPCWYSLQYVSNHFIFNLWIYRSDFGICGKYIYLYLSVIKYFYQVMYIVTNKVSFCDCIWPYLMWWIHADDDTVASSWLSRSPRVREFQAVTSSTCWRRPGNPADSVPDAALHRHRGPRLTGVLWPYRCPELIQFGTFWYLMNVINYD